MIVCVFYFNSDKCCFIEWVYCFICCFDGDVEFFSIIFFVKGYGVGNEFRIFVNYKLIIIIVV